MDEKEIRLVPVTTENWAAVCFLDPGEEGRGFVAPNAYSIAQSVYEKGWEIRGIQAGGRLIGFAMFGFDAEVDGYELCRFMLDRREQGKGLGKRALSVITREMFRRWPCDRIYLSTAPQNARGRHLYEAAGFVQTGESCGEGDDLEDVYCLRRDAPTA